MPSVSAKEFQLIRTTSYRSRYKSVEFPCQILLDSNAKDIKDSCSGTSIQTNQTQTDSPQTVLRNSSFLHWQTTAVAVMSTAAALTGAAAAASAAADVAVVVSSCGGRCSLHHIIVSSGAADEITLSAYTDPPPPQPGVAATMFSPFSFVLLGA